MPDGGHLAGAVHRKRSARIVQAQSGLQAHPTHHALTVRGLTFERCLTGLKVHAEANTQVSHNHFTDCFHGVELDLVSNTCTVQENTFIPGNGGTPVLEITATGINFNGNLTIQANTLQGLHEGIRLQSVAGPNHTVSRNTITNLTARPQFLASAPVGIRVQNTPNSNIQDNVVMATTPGTSRGIVLEASPGTQLGCNRLGNLAVGLDAGGDCLNSQLTHNVFRNCGAGVQLSPNGVLGAQGSLTTSHNNVWSNCQFGLRSIEADGRQSQFFVPTAGSSQIPNNSGFFANPADGSVVAPQELVLITTQPTETCVFNPTAGAPCSLSVNNCSGSDCAPQIPICGQPVGYLPTWPVGLKDSIGTELYGYWRVALGLHRLPMFDPESQYQAEAWLYAELRRNPQCKQLYPELDSFYQAHQETDLQRLCLAAERLRAHDTLTARLLNQAVVPQNLPQANLKAINTIDTDLQTAQAQQQARHQQQLANLLTAFEVDTLNPVFPALGIAWPTSLSAARPITPEQLTALRYLANQCPLEGGTGVYRARALRTQYDGHLTVYADSCPEQPELNPYRKAPHNTQATWRAPDQPQATLYPNPATDRLTITYKHLSPNAQIEVLTLTGQHILTQHLPETNGTIQLDTHTWATGLYLCRFNNPGSQSIGTIKLLINR
jgi:hypothetical protein